jgi:hypothetical protein
VAKRKQQTYQLGDRLTLQELEALGIERDMMGHLWGESSKDGRYARAVRTGAFRAPKKGEWYLSGAKPLAYRAPNDLSTEFRIMALVAVEKRTVVTERVGLPVTFE